MEKEGNFLLPTNSSELVGLLIHGVLSVNEVRKQLGLTPIEGGDVQFVMTATGPLPVERVMERYLEGP